MKTLDATTIANELEARGVELAKPVSDEHLKQFEAEMAVTLDEFFRQIYLKFNGFVSADDKTHIELWPLARILVEREVCLST
jgi:hypothetical protein